LILISSLGFAELSVKTCLPILISVVLSIVNRVIVCATSRADFDFTSHGRTFQISRPLEPIQAGGFNSLVNCLATVKL